MKLVGILLLQLLAMTKGEVSTQDYQKYTGSSALTGTSLDKTTARSATRCSSLCSQHEKIGESCHAARYNGETRACELMSRSSSGKERWLNDGEWKIYTNQQVVDECTNGWHLNGSSLYCVSKAGKYLNWTASRESCENMGATLVSITDEAEQDFVARLILASDHENGMDYWIAARNDGENGQWRWDTGETWNFTKPDFDSGSHNNLAQGSSCIYLYYLYNKDNTYVFPWWVLPCSFHVRYVCEKKE